MARVVDLRREVGAVEPRGQLLPEPGGLVGRDARAADPAVEQSADRQRLVAEELGLAAGAAVREPGAGSPGPSTHSAGRDRRRLAVGRRGDDPPEQCLDVPGLTRVRRDERHRQPVEQLGMARLVALRAEVLDALDDPRAENHLPVTVDGDPADQRMARGRQASGPAPGVAGRPSRQRRQDRRDARPTFSPVLSYWPRSRMKVSRGCGSSSMTIVVGSAFSTAAFRRASSALSARNRASTATSVR